MTVIGEVILIRPLPHYRNDSAPMFSFQYTHTCAMYMYIHEKQAKLCHMHVHAHVHIHTCIYRVPRLGCISCMGECTPIKLGNVTNLFAVDPPLIIWLPHSQPHPSWNRQLVYKTLVARQRQTNACTHACTCAHTQCTCRQMLTDL